MVNGEVELIASLLVQEWLQWALACKQLYLRASGVMELSSK
jgi:hypothetical protein